MYIYIYKHPALGLPSAYVSHLCGQVGQSRTRRKLPASFQSPQAGAGPGGDMSVPVQSPFCVRCRSSLGGSSWHQDIYIYIFIFVWGSGSVLTFRDVQGWTARGHLLRLGPMILLRTAFPWPGVRSFSDALGLYNLEFTGGL